MSTYLDLIRSLQIKAAGTNDSQAYDLMESKVEEYILTQEKVEEYTFTRC